MGKVMTNEEGLEILGEIEQAIQAKRYKPTIVERDFILKMGSQCRTPQKLTLKQWKWLQGLYRASRGLYQKKWPREEKINAPSRT